MSGAIKITYRVEAGGLLKIRLTGSETINWGDGTIEDYNGRSSVSHTYNTSGTYQLTIKGDISKIYIETTNAYVQSFDQLDLESLKDASASLRSFAEDCSEATGTIPKLPPNLTDGFSMFRGCSGLSGTAPSQPPLIDKDTCGDDMWGACYFTFFKTLITNDNDYWPAEEW